MYQNLDFLSFTLNQVFPSNTQFSFLTFHLITYIFTHTQLWWEITIAFPYALILIWIPMNSNFLTFFRNVWTSYIFAAIYVKVWDIRSTWIDYLWKYVHTFCKMDSMTFLSLIFSVLFLSPEKVLLSQQSRWYHCSNTTPAFQ